MAESKEPTSIFIETTDAQGIPITVFSTDGKLRTTADFATAIDNYDNGQKPTPGFLTLPSNTFQGKMRTGFEESVGRFARETVPAVGEAVGGIAGLSPILALAQKAGLLSSETAKAPVLAGKGAGRAVGQFVGEQFDTPGEAGMMLGTGAISPYLKAPTSAAGQFLKIPWLANILKSGAAGLTGATAMRAATGEELSPGQNLIDFAIPAVGGSMQGIVSHFLTKYLNKGMPEKVAKGIMDTFKERHPNMSFGDNILDIASSSQTELSNLTQQMSKGVRNSIEEDTEMLLTGIKNVLPGVLPAKQSVPFQNTLRKGIRNVIAAQNKQLDNIGDRELFAESGKGVNDAVQELTDTIRGFTYERANFGKQGPFIPKSEMTRRVDMNPAALKTEMLLDQFQKQTRKYDESALVLHYMKQAGGAEGFDFNKFAQLIKGVYNETPGSQLSRVGEILGQGRPLTAMPKAQVEEPPSNWLAKMIDAGYNKLGPVGKALTLKDRSPQMPWPGPREYLNATSAGRKIPSNMQTPMQPLINFGAQEGAQVPSQAALRSFVNQGEQK